MGTLFRHSRHIVRMVGLFGVGLVSFILLRAIFIPKGFGELGHFRTGALAENRARPVTFAGRKACVECHTDVAEKQKGTSHEAVSCENCHGPQAAHANAADPFTAKPKLPDSDKLCGSCHEKNVGKPKKFKQVDSKEHAGGAACKSCHAPHAPAPKDPSTPAATSAPKPPAKEVKP